MMKKMGWKPGKGVGQKMTRRALERQKGYYRKLFIINFKSLK
jgi:hypothetical protein